MNVDEAMKIASKQGGLPETDEWYDELIDALDVLSAEVERLRAELAETKAENVGLGEGHYRLEAELAAAKAASACPVEVLNIFDGTYETFTDWLRERMKERGE